jgi:ubiquinone/menaquinone biosynthesis C-methylase UbiE
MVRTVFIIILFSVSCTLKTSEKGIVKTYQDTTQVRQSESFDLKVRKYEDPKRQTWQDPKFVIEALGDLNDKTVADIGSGTGYFTFQMALPAKKVIAIDIEQRFLNYIEDRKTEMYDRALAKKIETRITTANSSSLTENEVDIVLMVNTIGYIQDRNSYLQRLRKAITKDGSIVIVDYKIGKMPVGPDEEVKVSAEEVVKALERTGFTIDRVDTKSLQYQYLIKARNL